MNSASARSSSARSVSCGEAPRFGKRRSKRCPPAIPSRRRRRCRRPVARRGDASPPQPRRTPRGGWRRGRRGRGPRGRARGSRRRDLCRGRCRRRFGVARRGGRGMRTGRRRAPVSGSKATSSRVSSRRGMWQGAETMTSASSTTSAARPSTRYATWTSSACARHEHVHSTIQPSGASSQGALRASIRRARARASRRARENRRARILVRHAGLWRHSQAHPHAAPVRRPKLVARVAHRRAGRVPAEPPPRRNEVGTAARDAIFSRRRQVGACRGGNSSSEKAWADGDRAGRGRVSGLKAARVSTRSRGSGGAGTTQSAHVRRRERRERHPSRRERRAARNSRARPSNTGGRPGTPGENTRRSRLGLPAILQARAHHVGPGGGLAPQEAAQGYVARRTRDEHALTTRFRSQNPLLAPETSSNRADGRVPRAPTSLYTRVSASHAFSSPDPPLPSPELSRTPSRASPRVSWTTPTSLSGRSPSWVLPTPCSTSQI